MTAAFQTEILKYMVQMKDGKQYIPLMDTKMFDMPEYAVAYEILEKYVGKYKGVPKEVNMIEFMTDALKESKTKITKDQKLVIEQAIHSLYKPLDSETRQIKEKIVEYAQYRKTTTMVNEYSGKLKDGGVEVFRKMKQEMNKIVSIGDDTSALSDKNKGGFLIKDMGTHIDEHNEGIPLFLKGMNRLTAAGGFHAPQLVVLMGGPKSFKTGLLIKFGLELMRDGKKVYYADNENGVKRIRNRFKQAMIEVDAKEMRDGRHDELLLEMSKKFAMFGGDVVIDHYPAHKCCMDDLDANLTELKETYGWEPDVILIDYADLWKPNDPKITDKRIMIQHVYFDIINLNNKWDVFSITPTPVNKTAVSKAVIEITDFAEDFGKAYNCHSAWALCRTPEERIAGMARLVPITQRDGVSYVKGAGGVQQVYLEIDETTMTVTEAPYRDEPEENTVEKKVKKVDKSRLRDE